MREFKKYIFLASIISFSGLQAGATGLNILYKDLTIFMDNIAVLEDYLKSDGTIGVPISRNSDVAGAQQLATELMKMVAPLYASLFRSAQSGTQTVSGSGTQDPDTVVGAAGIQLVQTYQQTFTKYVSRYGTSGKPYQTLQFGSLFLPLLLAKNVLKNDLSTLGLTNIAGLTASQVTPQLLAHAQALQTAFIAFQNFIKSRPENLQAPLSLAAVPPLLVGYDTFNRYATAILQYKQGTGVASLANSYIAAHFTDTALVGAANLAAVNRQVVAFNKLYKKTDAYFTVYKMWALYVPLRYLELQFLKNQTVGSANLYMSLYQKTLSALQGMSSSLPAPYAGQCADSVCEFQVVYQLAKNVATDYQQ